MSASQDPLAGGPAQPLTRTERRTAVVRDDQVGVIATIAYEVTEPVGPGPRFDLPLLLVHGACHTLACWRRWAEHLAGLGYTVIAPSLRDHPPSASERGNVHTATFGDYAADVYAVAQEERLGDRFLLVGHSMGGIVVQYYLHEHGAAGVVILDSSTIASFMAAQSGTFKALLPNVGLLARTLIGGDLRLAFRECPRLLFGEKKDGFIDAAEAEELLAALVPESRAILSESRARAFRQRGRAPLRTEHALLLAGDHDVFFSERVFTRCAADLRRLGVADVQQCVLRGPHNLMLAGDWRGGADQVALFAVGCGARPLASDNGDDIPSPAGTGRIPDAALTALGVTTTATAGAGAATATDNGDTPPPPPPALTVTWQEEVEEVAAGAAVPTPAVPFPVAAPSTEPA